MAMEGDLVKVHYKARLENGELVEDTYKVPMLAHVANPVLIYESLLIVTNPITCTPFLVRLCVLLMRTGR